MNSEAEQRLPGNIVFIRIPDSMARKIGAFQVEPEILLPVELGKDSTVLESLNELSWEMLVAGMLRLLAYHPDNENAAYYRRFILAVKPDIYAELSDTGILKARNGDLDVAEEIFLALCGLCPENPQPLVNLAVLHEDRAEALDKAGKEDLADVVREKAFTAYKTLLGMEPAFPDAFFNAGFFFLKTRNYGRACEVFETYLSLGDDEPKLQKAREIVQRLRDRGQRDSTFKEAFDFIKMGREEEGISRAMSFLEKDPNVWNGWFLVGWANRRLARWEQGREAFLKALELGAEEVDLLNELSICELELGLLSQARGHLERALRLESDNVKILSNLAVLARKQGRDGEAASFFRLVLDAVPDDELALKQLEELEG